MLSDAFSRGLTPGDYVIIGQGSGYLLPGIFVGRFPSGYGNPFATILLHAKVPPKFSVRRAAAWRTIKVSKAFVESLLKSKFKWSPEEAEQYLQSAEEKFHQVSSRYPV